MFVVLMLILADLRNCANVTSLFRNFENVEVRPLFVSDKEYL
jgi:hypothetical protein